MVPKALYAGLITIWSPLGGFAVDGYSHNEMRLTSVEMGVLWNTYMIESMVHHILSYCLHHIEDRDLVQLFTVWQEETRDSLNLLNHCFRRKDSPLL